MPENLTVRKRSLSWAYRKRWLARWAAEVRSPHMVGHVLGASAGLISSLVGARFDTAPATWTKLWHGALAAVAGYAALMLILATVKAFGVSSKLDADKQQSINHLEDELKSLREENATNLDKLKRSQSDTIGGIMLREHLGKMLDTAELALDEKRREIERLTIKIEQLEHPFTAQRRQHFLDKLNILTAKEKDVLYYLITTGASGVYAGWEAAIKMGQPQGDDLRSAIRHKTGFLRIAHHGEEIHPEFRPLLEHWGSTYQPSQAAENKLVDLRCRAHSLGREIFSYLHEQGPDPTPKHDPSKTTLENVQVAWKASSPWTEKIIFGFSAHFSDRACKMRDELRGHGIKDAELDRFVENSHGQGIAEIIGIGERLIYLSAGMEIKELYEQ